MERKRIIILYKYKIMMIVDKKLEIINIEGKHGKNMNIVKGDV